MPTTHGGSDVRLLPLSPLPFPSRPVVSTLRHRDTSLDIPPWAWGEVQLQMQGRPKSEETGRPWAGAAGLLGGQTSDLLQDPNTHAGAISYRMYAHMYVQYRKEGDGQQAPHFSEASLDKGLVAQVVAHVLVRVGQPFDLQGGYNAS